MCRIFRPSTGKPIHRRYTLTCSKGKACDIANHVFCGLDHLVGKDQEVILHLLLLRLSHHDFVEEGELLGLQLTTVIGIHHSEDALGDVFWARHLIFLAVRLVLEEVLDDVLVLRVVEESEVGQLSLDNVQLIKEVLEGDKFFKTDTGIIIAELFADLTDLPSEFFYRVATQADKSCLEEVLGRETAVFTGFKSMELIVPEIFVELGL